MAPLIEGVVETLSASSGLDPTEDIEAARTSVPSQAGGEVVLPAARNPKRVGRGAAAGRRFSIIVRPPFLISSLLVFEGVGTSRE